MSKKCLGGGELDTAEKECQNPLVLEGQCGRIFLSPSEGAGLNGWLLSCDLKRRTAQPLPCFLGCHAGMCRRCLCPSPERSRREAPPAS